MNENRKEQSRQALNYPDSQVLLMFFNQLGLNVKKEALEQEYSRQVERSLVLFECVKGVLHHLNIQGIKGGVTSWRRFDRRHLPALVSYDGQWWLAENQPNSDTVVLSNGTHDESVIIESSVLAESSVLWLKRSDTESEDCLDDKDVKTARGLILKALFREKAWLGNIIIATIIINVLAVATSLFALQVYDRVVPTLAYSTLTTLVGGMLIIVVLDWTLKHLRSRILDSLAADVDMRLSKQVFDHLLHLRLDKQPSSLGTLTAQVSALESVRQFFTSSIVFALIDLPFAVMFIAFIAVIGGAIGWVYAALFPVALVLGLVTQFRLRKLIKQHLIRSNERQGLLIDVIRGCETIRSNNAGWRFAHEWEKITRSLASYQVRQKAISQVSTTTTGSLSTVAYVSAIIVGVFQIEAGNITMGAMIACSILGGRVINPVSQGVQYLVQWQSVSQSLNMVDQLLALDLERRPSQHLLASEEKISSLSAEGVRFVYGDSPVKQLDIDHLNFKAGDRVLLVGPIGCGKSTLLKVLAGLYRSAEGRIKLGNLDLWEIEPQYVSSHISYLPQNVHLFKGTLKSNLSLSGTVSDVDMMEVATQLGIDRIAQSHPKGMDMELSEGGEGLSGGQRQLVALSRIMTAKPTIWLLDEPTASLDNDSEKRVWETLMKHIKPTDILIVSTHRPMLAAQIANRVLVMQQGKVVKDGAPSEVFSGLPMPQNKVLRKQSPLVAKRGVNNAV